MKTKYLLGSLLVASVSLNLFTFLTGMKPGVECPELPSYASPA